MTTSGDFIKLIYSPQIYNRNDSQKITGVQTGQMMIPNSRPLPTNSDKSNIPKSQDNFRAYQTQHGVGIGPTIINHSDAETVSVRFKWLYISLKIFSCYSFIFKRFPSDEDNL